MSEETKLSKEVIAARLERLMEEHRGVLNRLEPHLGCVTCHGELAAGKCPRCQPGEFVMGKTGKLEPRGRRLRCTSRGRHSLRSERRPSRRGAGIRSTADRSRFTRA